MSMMPAPDDPAPSLLLRDSDLSRRRVSLDLRWRCRSSVTGRKSSNSSYRLALLPSNRTEAPRWRRLTSSETRVGNSFSPVGASEAGVQPCSRGRCDEAYPSCLHCELGGLLAHCTEMRLPSMDLPCLRRQRFWSVQVFWLTCHNTRLQRLSRT